MSAGLNHSDRARKHKQAQLESGHDMYEKYLGLSLERQIKGALVFKMHNVDPNEPKRQFSFAVRINDDNEQYSGMQSLQVSCEAHGRLLVTDARFVACSCGLAFLRRWNCAQDVRSVFMFKRK